MSNGQGFYLDTRIYELFMTSIKRGLLYDQIPWATKNLQIGERFYYENIYNELKLKYGSKVGKELFK